MYGALDTIDDLFQPSLPNPAVAAAVAVLTAASPPPMRLGQALCAVAPHLTTAERTAWVAILAAALPQAGITTSRCAAAFLGQCAVESDGFQSLQEDLSYSATRLCEVWPSHFPSLSAANTCALQPETLANRVYANRMGNGDEASGDGWQFRGRGLIQLTGRAAYQRFAEAMNMTLEQAVEHASTQTGAAETATWFWSTNRLNALANTWSVDLITRKINGGTAGAAERIRLSEAALHAIGA